MKKPIKELKMPPEVKNDKMIRKESLMSSLLGLAFSFLGFGADYESIRHVYDGYCRHGNRWRCPGSLRDLAEESRLSLLIDGQLAWTMIESLVIWSLLVSMSSRL